MSLDALPAHRAEVVPTAVERASERGRCVRGRCVRGEQRGQRRVCAPR